MKNSSDGQADLIPSMDGAAANCSCGHGPSAHRNIGNCDTCGHHHCLHDPNIYKPGAGICLGFQCNCECYVRTTSISLFPCCLCECPAYRHAGEVLH